MCFYRDRSSTRRTPFTLAGALALVCTPLLGAASAPDSVIISEILFNVPRTDDADANKDGERHAAGDEFVELYNPTDEPIQLEGYAILNRLTWEDRDTSYGVQFTFPKFELPAKRSVIVFNGYDADIEGPLGTPDAPPAGTNEHFNGAYVFTMETSRRTNAFRNGGDFAVLAKPDGTPIQCIAWGEPEPAPPEEHVSVNEVPHRVKGSVHRPKPGKAFVEHEEHAGIYASPGRVAGVEQPD